jgi:hypothetical protein
VKLGKLSLKRQGKSARAQAAGPKGQGQGSAHPNPGAIRKPKSGEFRLYSRKKDAATGKRRNLGTFSTLEKAKQHEREVQYFKKRG